MIDPTKKAEMLQNLWEQMRLAKTAYVLITTCMGKNNSLAMRGCKYFRYGTSHDRVGLMREQTCPSGSTSIQSFATTQYRESPLPMFILGDGFHDEDSDARVEIFWPKSMKIEEPEVLYFEGELLAEGDNHGRFVNVDEARTKSEFNLKFVHKGVSLKGLLHEIDRDGRIPCFMLPPCTRVFPPMVETTHEILQLLRQTYPNRIFIKSGYLNRPTFSVISIEPPSTWNPAEHPGSKIRSVSTKRFDVVEIVRSRPLFGPDADDLEDEAEREEHSQNGHAAASSESTTMSPVPAGATG